MKESMTIRPPQAPAHLQILSLLLVSSLLLQAPSLAFAESTELKNMEEKKPVTCSDNGRDPNISMPGLSKEELRRRLTPEQFKVTQENGTEAPFANEYWNNKKEGIYVDIVSGEALFSSLDKFDSGSGWPSFTKPIVEKNIVEKADSSFGMKRVEIRSKNANSHLGHLFDDGPGPTKMRYCTNSSSLRFIPV